MVAQVLPCMDELWIAFGTGKNYRYIPAHEIAASLGPQKARALPVFYAMTGFDTHMKRSAVFQGGYVWGQVLVPQPVLPSPTSWGRRQTEDRSYEPLWTTLPEASSWCRAAAKKAVETAANARRLICNALDCANAKSHCL
ncbi:hypothetical protein Pcinc_027321 [Petrolisthes cinctipes]|uniref:Uncharacterized protein n=1 Tax=Petrolisthes cinctipes TaxID=88211 RepID=A0AAE1K8T1_PETCI|nr:hypothetical protein Pcinc_027321 [Petrolisthes cinctipes]